LDRAKLGREKGWQDEILRKALKNRLDDELTREQRIERQRERIERARKRNSLRQAPLR
jgi:hypothetical protein